MRVAVLGGGISGLSLTYYLKRLVPNAQIQLIEKSNRFGGWLETQTEPFHVESGPRTLRPSGQNGATTLDLIHQLNLQDKLLLVKKDSPSNKAIYLLGENEMEKVPRQLGMDMITTKHGRMLVKAVLNDLITKSADMNDETIDEFASRRLSKAMANSLMAAMIHGIYAGESKTLSIKSCFPTVWNAEKHAGSIVRGMYKGANLKYEESSKSFVLNVQRSATAYSFQGGMQTFVDGLRGDLEKNGVELLLNNAIESMSMANDKVYVNNSEYDKVISTLPANVLGGIMKEPYKSPLFQIPFVDVAIVSLAYKDASVPHAFGALSYVKSIEKNPNGLLGIVFESASLPQLDNGYNRFTVMIGGHMFNRFQTSAKGISLREHALNVATRSLRQFVSINDAPIYSHVDIHKNCIAQYTLGHVERLKSIQMLIGSKFSGKVSLLGSSYFGVSVPDCIARSKEFAVWFSENK